MLKKELIEILEKLPDDLCVSYIDIAWGAAAAIKTVTISNEIVDMIFNEDTNEYVYITEDVILLQ